MGATRNGSSPAKPQTGERGVTGASSYLGESLFQYGKRRRPTVLQLDNMLSFDSWAEAIEGALTWPIRSAHWAITPAAGDTGEAEEATRQFERISARAIAGALGAVGRRVSYAEQVWGVDPENRSSVILEDLAFRPVDQCELIRDENGRPTGFRQRSYSPGRGFVNELFLRANSKAFVFLHDEASRPGVGRSALETAYQHYEDKEKVAFYRNKALEKYGAPSTHGKTDAVEGSDERQSVEQAVRDARSGASITTGRDTEINYLAPPNSGEAFQAARREMNFEMAVASFVQWLSLSQEGNSGAYELSRDHSDFLTIVTEGRMGMLSDALTTGPIHDLTYHNRGPGAAFPVFEFEPISENAQKLMREGAELLFRKNGSVMPSWLREGIAEGFGNSLGIEKPEGAEDRDPVGDPVRSEPRERPEEGGESE